MTALRNNHLLLTALGTAPREVTYSLNGRTARASFAPLALVKLLSPSQQPTRVLTIVTEGARTVAWPNFSESMQSDFPGITVDSVQVPSGVDRDELRQIVESVAAQVPAGCELTLDVTHGLRHFPFVLYALALYLTSLHNVRLRGAYYGMMEASTGDAPKPIVDLRPLLRLPEWFYAVRVFREFGLAAPIAERIRQDIQNPEPTDTSPTSSPDIPWPELGRMKKAATRLQRFSFAYGAGLPLELGKFAERVASAVPEATKSEAAHQLPLVESLAEIVRQAAKPLAFTRNVPSKGQWKESVPLDADELERQARIIDSYFERDEIALAVGLMREWIVSWAMWKDGCTSDWLKRKTREKYERRLNTLAHLLQDKNFDVPLTPEQRELGQGWDRVANQFRNAFHHHGMRPESIKTTPETLKPVREFWRRLRTGDIGLPDLGGGGGRLLISPQGSRPGVLYSAVCAARAVGEPPDRCLVICSNDSANTVDEALEKAGFQRAVEKLVLQDPYAGVAELERLVSDATPFLFDADTVVANLTGGTTLMGIAVQKLVDAARKLDRPVYRFFLIDRRDPEEQSTNPYVPSDHHCLDSVPSPQSAELERR